MLLLKLTQSSHILSRFNDKLLTEHQVSISEILLAHLSFTYNLSVQFTFDPNSSANEKHHYNYYLQVTWYIIYIHIKVHWT